MTTATKALSAKQLAKKLIALAGSAGITVDARTGQQATHNFWAVGGMIRPFGEFNALYYSPTGKPDAELLEGHLMANWDMIQIIGHLGLWKTPEGELFIDSVYTVPCGCDTEAGYSEASFRFAFDLGRSNQQDEICHVCETLPTPLCFPTI